MSQAGPVDVTQNMPQIPTQFNADTGSAIPIANQLNIFGDNTEGVSTTASGNTVVIHVETGPVWHTITANQTLAVAQGYICISPGGALSLALPAISIVGDTIEVTLDGATSFRVTQSAGQQIRIGNTSTTAGVGGSITSNNQGDSIRMVCSVADLKWNVLSSMGNPTVI